MRSVNVDLTENQIKFLIDVLWGTDARMTRQLAWQHQVKDGDIVRQLTDCLASRAGHC